MSPLGCKLDELRRRLRQLVVLRGCAWLLTILILGALAACCADAWWHLDSVAVRVSLLILLAGTALLGGILLIILPWLRTIPDTELARQIQLTRSAAHPSLQSSVEFDTRSCSPDCGAPGLQQAVVTEQAQRLSALVVNEIVDTRPVQRAVFCSLAVSLLAAGALLADRPRAALALHRLIMPAQAPAWPREHTLRLLDAQFQPLSNSDPIIVALGRTPTFYVEDARGRLPDQILLQVWHEEGGLQELRLQSRDAELDEQAPRQLAPFSIPPHAGETRLRAVGGDDHRMPWHTVHRIPPPDITQLHVTVRPPEYTRRPAFSVTNPTAPLEVLIGTQIELELTANKTLQDVALRREGQRHRPIQDPDRSDERFIFSWEVLTAGRTPFWFEMTDPFGLQNLPPTRFDILAVEDREPVVSIEHPPGSMTLTPIAEVPFRCIAEDDVGLSQVRLLYSDPPGSEQTRVYALPAVDEGAQRADLETTLSLDRLAAQPGTRIVFRAEATDACDFGPEHVGRSGSHTVLVVTPEEKLQELLHREIGIAETLERASAMQTESARQTRQLRLQWEHTAMLRPQDQDLLNRVIHDASRTQAELYDERRGAESRVADIRRELEWNRINDEATSNRLNLVLDELRRLKSQAIPPLQRSLATARKASATLADDEPAQVTEALASAELRQIEVAETLQVLLGMLRGWRERYDLMRSLAEISDEQQQLTDETAAFGQPLLERDALDEQDEADFARFAARQEHLADQLADLVDSAAESAGQNPDDPDNLQQLADALRRSGVAEAMSHTAELLRSHNVGEAMMAQADLIEALHSLTEVLNQWEPTDTHSLIEQLERAEQDVEALHRRQAEARERATALSAADTTAEPQLLQLRREQQALAEETAESALRLRKQNIVGAAASSAAAADAMRAAAGGLQDEITEPVLRHQQQALDDLQQAQQELAQLRQTLELRLALQQAGELVAMLETHRDRQLELRNQAVDLRQAQQQTGRLRRSQLGALLDLKRTQSGLAADVTSLTTDVEDMPAFRIVLNAAIDAMHAAGDRLTPESLAAAPQFQTRAADRLTEIVDALHAAPSTPTPTTGPGSPTDETQSGQLDWTLIAQVRLLHRMQTQIADRVAELNRTSSADEPLTGEQQLELDELTVLQEQAADLADDLLQELLGLPESADPALQEAVP